MEAHLLAKEAKDGAAGIRTSVDPDLSRFLLSRWRSRVGMTGIFVGGHAIAPRGKRKRPI